MHILGSFAEEPIPPRGARRRQYSSSYAGTLMIDTRAAAWDQLEAASLVLGEAFADYPWTRWTVDSSDHQGRVIALQRLALERLAMPYERCA
jgi:hypothetical protein